MAKRAVYDVTPEQFIETWQTAESADEVAQKLSMPKAIVLARASNYRSQGIQLKTMRARGRKAIDVKNLNKLISKINKEQGIEEEPHSASKKPRARSAQEVELSDDEVTSVMRQLLDSIRSNQG